jgi:hypothetical protein
MSTQTNTLLTNNLDSVTSSQSIGSSLNTLTIGNTSNAVSIGNLYSTSVKPKVYVFSTQTITLTVANILLNGSIINSTYSSANPSTVNDIITVNLPVATSAIDGVYFIFRKMRGALNGSSQNWNFVTSPASLINGTTTVSTSGIPTTTLVSSTLVVRLQVIGLNGTYYWVNV